MVSDGYNLTLDLDHWNRANPDEKPISLPMDIEIRKAAGGEGESARLGLLPACFCGSSSYFGSLPGVERFRAGLAAP